MKNILLFTFLIGTSILVRSQNLDVGYGFGSGATYIFESQDNGIDISYSTPFSSYVHLTYIPENSLFNLKLNFQYVNSGIEGTNWKTGNQINGEVSSFTTLLLLEKLKNDQKWNFGYNFGFGYSIESYVQNLEKRTAAEYRRFMSLAFSGLVSVKISERVSMQLTPSLLWSDPANSLRSPRNWNIAGEDLSFLTQLGFVYRLK